MAYRRNTKLPPWAQERWRNGIGADAPTGDPRVRILQQQVNRYVPSRFAKPVLVNGVMDQPTAYYAAGALYDRAKRALDTFGPSEPATGPYHKMHAEALAHVAAPLPWVADHLDQVIDDVAHYADFLGLPPASGSLSRLVSDWRVWAAAAGVGILVLGRRRKR